MQVITEMYKFYTSEANSGKRALVHCRQGHGRTGTTVLILTQLLQSRYGTKEDTTQIDTLKALRAQRDGLCETYSQFNFA